MSLALGIIVVVLSVATALFVAYLFVWAARKDGQENDAIQSRIIRRRWPRDSK